LPKHPTTPLASSQINHDQLAVELVEPDSMPAMVRIVWPSAPTIVDPKFQVLAAAAQPPTSEVDPPASRSPTIGASAARFS
jgi:hypothetical protein